MPTIYVLSKNKIKYQNVYSENFHYLQIENLCILNMHDFIMFTKMLFTQLTVYSLYRHLKYCPQG